MSRVAIVGGGLAGLTCAKELVGTGREVSVYEGLPWLGGRASTFVDDDGDWIEQELLLFLGTSDRLRQALDDIGQPADPRVVHWLDEIRFEQVGGPSAHYAINPLRAPFRTALLALGQNRYLGPIDKLRSAAVLAPSLADLETLRRELDDRSVVDWWRRARGPEHLLERVLRPICRALQLTDAEDVSAFALLGLVHQILADLPHALAGAYVGPRDLTMFRPWATWLQARGARIHTGRKLAAVLQEARHEQPRVGGLLFEDGERVEADTYVLALPFWELLPRLPEAWRAEPFFANLASLPVAPALSVQLWFDREVVDSPLYTLVAGSEVAAYQEQSKLTGPHHGSRLSVMVSPADAWLDHSDAEIVGRTLAALGDVQPEVRPERVEKRVVLRHRRHLLRAAPGVLSRRPTQHTPVPDLFLAGDWTSQDGFGTQEGAVRSGIACAQAIVDAADVSEGERIAG